ncbi:hypothetical protein Q3G72_002384 [Acer saccharum]|nr:hypothetical protein Q3G72_002384 [Acer saccharum]
MMENILMNNISGPNLPPGIRFHPTDQELIIHYLKKKVSSSSSSSSPPNPVVSIIADVDIYKFNPWELPEKARFGESEWFFFSPRDRKYPNGTRPNRAAGSGYWKATGTDKPILSSSSGGGGSQSQYCLGVKKALVFYQGRSPKGTKTNWMMLEYKLIDDAFRSQKLFRASMRSLKVRALMRAEMTILPLKNREIYNLIRSTDILLRLQVVDSSRRCLSAGWNSRNGIYRLFWECFATNFYDFNSQIPSRKYSATSFRDFI